MATEKFRRFILEKAAANIKHIVLPEGDDPRMLEAAKTVVENNIANITLLGDVAKITGGPDGHRCRSGQGDDYRSGHVG